MGGCRRTRDGGCVAGFALGLALLRNALGEFYRRGCGSVELLVDSDSLTGALRLYERAGMRAFRTQLIYEKELRAGVDITTRGV